MQIALTHPITMTEATRFAAVWPCSFGTDVSRERNDGPVLAGRSPR
jgi:hypothetical protein